MYLPDHSRSLSRVTARCPLCIQIWRDTGRERESDREMARREPVTDKMRSPVPRVIIRGITIIIIRSCHWMLMSSRPGSSASRRRPSSSWDSWLPSLWLMRRVTGPGYYEPWRIASCYIVITNVKYLTQIFHTPRSGPVSSCFQLGISYCWVRGEFGMNGLKYQMIPCPVFSPFIS